MPHMQWSASSLPYRRHRGHTALCWTLWHNPIQECLYRATDTHLSPGPCTGWTPDTPQSVPGYQDPLSTNKECIKTIWLTYVCTSKLNSNSKSHVKGKASTCCYHCKKLGSKMAVWGKPTRIRMLVLEVSCSDAFLCAQEVRVLDGWNM